MLSPGRDDRFPRRCDSERGGHGVSATTRPPAATELPTSRGRKGELARVRSATWIPVVCVWHWPMLAPASADALSLLGPLGPGDDSQIRAGLLVEHGEVLEQVTVGITKVHGGGRHPADDRRLLGLLAEE
jgi:hypothetical protein